jgi:hypothetical protein
MPILRFGVSPMAKLHLKHGNSAVLGALENWLYTAPVMAQSGRSETSVSDLFPYENSSFVG